MTADHWLGVGIVWAVLLLIVICILNIKTRQGDSFLMSTIDGPQWLRTVMGMIALILPPFFLAALMLTILVLATRDLVIVPFFRWLERVDII